MSVEGVHRGVVAPGLPKFHSRPRPSAVWSWKFTIFKAVSDVTLAILAVPIIAGIAVVLLVLNPFFNPGPLFFRQDRMGLGGQRFSMWKFRTMRPASTQVRAFNAGVEKSRITPLGHFLRVTRLDEMPNFINVLRGEMSVVGPRPEAWSHATKYMPRIPYYRDRFRVKPGITGLAQIRCGYADDIRSVRLKAKFDRYYVMRSRGRLELWILFQTFGVMWSGNGAK